MSSYDSKAKRAAYLSALQTLDKGPKEIAAAQQQYKADQQHIREMEAKGIWAPVAVQRMKDQAKEKLDTATRKGVDKMRSALDTVRAEQNSREKVDINSARIQNLINTVNTMGKDLSYDMQIDIIDNFKGDTAGLQFVHDLFKRKGLHTADYAKSLTKGVSGQALENMQYAISKYDYFGEWDNSKNYWTGGEFAQAHERFAADGSEDPYIEALKAIKRENKDDAAIQEGIANALIEIAKGKETGEIVDTATVFRNALADLEANE